jgi:hypothetical protein
MLATVMNALCLQARLPASLTPGGLLFMPLATRIADCRAAVAMLLLFLLPTYGHELAVRLKRAALRLL